MRNNQKMINHHFQLFMKLKKILWYKRYGNDKKAPKLQAALIVTTALSLIIVTKQKS